MTKVMTSADVLRRLKAFIRLIVQNGDVFTDLWLTRCQIGILGNYDFARRVARSP